jgi:hypothetical protein
MELPDERDPRIALMEEEEDASPLDDSDDPWIGGNEDSVPEVTRDYPGRPIPNQAKAMGSDGRSAGPRGVASGTSLVGEPEALRRQWESVQVGFVDDPKRAVEDAEQLVAVVAAELVDNFRLQRQRLEATWSEDTDGSLNDLRQAFQRYRDFFERLLQI